MKTILSITSAVAIMALAALPAKAQVTYWSANSAWVNGGWADGAGISSVVVNHTASDITFTINTSQPMATWIMYAIQIQIVGQAGSGSTALSNPLWGSGGPAIGISTGENAVLNFNDAGGGAGNNGNIGAAAYKYSGSWVGSAGVAYAAGGAASSFATATVSLSSLGLSVGDSFYFDAVSTYSSWQNGAPQSAYSALDTLANPKETDGLASPWNPTVPTYYDSATDAGGTTFGAAASLYTVAAVPEPGTMALLSGGLIFLMVQRRSSRNRSV
jgi:hypothetical protein